MNKRSLGRTQLSVSPIGFGCYRVSDELQEHHEALEYALETGFNLIDTSSNYTNGSSEILVGTTLAKCEAEGIISRSDVVIVSKGGYIQGRNYDDAIERERKSNPYTDLVRYAPGLWHCIHPEFLENQIARSLNRLQVESIDVYLLHNPEYYLEYCEKEHVPLDIAREKFYARIEKAFKHLEYEVVQGRINWYGISSNTFPTPPFHPTHVSLERACEIAERMSPSHHFAVIQCPMNLYETAAATLRNQSNNTGTLLQYAIKKNLGVLINRPLNAFYNNQLIRLAEPPIYTEITEDEIRTAIFRLKKNEMGMKNLLTGSVLDNKIQNDLPNLLCIGNYVEENWKKLSSPPQLNELFAQHFHPRFQYVRQIVQDAPQASDELQATFHHYRMSYRDTIETLAAFLSNKTRSLNQNIHAKLASILPGEFIDATLSQKALLALTSTPGITSTLLGMRTVDYVDDAHSVMSLVENSTQSFDWVKWKEIMEI